MGSEPETGEPVETESTSSYFDRVPPVAGLVLAAGGSTRLGRPKQLEPWGGSTLLGAVLSETKTWPLTEIWVVLGANQQNILRQVDLEDMGIVYNPEWSDGLASSLRAGFDALLQKSTAGAALVILGDQPRVSPEVVADLIEEHKYVQDLAIIPRYGHHLGNPVLITRPLWPRMLSLSGDRGARSLLEANRGWVRELPVSDAPPPDVDTDRDVRRFSPSQGPATGPRVGEHLSAH